MLQLSGGAKRQTPDENMLTACARRTQQERADGIQQRKRADGMDGCRKVERGGRIGGKPKTNMGC